MPILRSQRPSQEIHIRGLGVSPGLAVGRAHFHEAFFIQPENAKAPAVEADTEWERFQRALAVTKEQLQDLLGRAADSAGTQQAGIFEAHLLMAEDPALLAEVEKAIRVESWRADSAFYRVMDRYITAMRQFDDPYLRERVADLEDVTRRVLRNLEGDTQRAQEKSPHVLLAHDLTPSETVEMDKNRVLGFATEAGSATSHTAILARSLGIPAVVGLHDLRPHVQAGDTVLLDGSEGVLIINPTEETISTYESARQRRAKIDRQLYALREGEAFTRDGRRIIVSANIELASEVDGALAQGAEGIGLYRTEFLFLNRQTWPDEEEQAANYIRAAQAAGPHGIIIRTLDVGGDKLPGREPDWQPEVNPFLGWRGIRRSLRQPEIFRQQVRAILRASAYGKVRIMFPLIATLDEVRGANAMVDRCMAELRAEGIPFDEHLERGAMIEVPSAAVIADLIAPEVDFLSVGTNDLIQYTIAVDRVNERVADLYQPCHPAIVRLLKQTVQAAESAGIWTGVCGEMAGDLVLTPLLIGLGFQELSMGATQIPRLKHAIRTLDAAECRAMVDRLLAARVPQGIYTRCRQMARSYYAELLE